MGFRVIWKEENLAEEEQRLYRSTSPMDPNNLPAPIDVLAPDVQLYYDGAVTEGQTYYYRVGAVTAGGTVEKVSDELEVVATEDVLPPLRSSVMVELRVEDPTHQATTAAQDALVSAGFDANNITIREDYQAVTEPTPDIILVTRGIDTQGQGDIVKNAWLEGVPVVFGVKNLNNATTGTGKNYPSTYAGLTGTFTQFNEVSDEVDIVDAGHYITQHFGPGRLQTHVDPSWGGVVSPGQPWTGTLLANGDPDVAVAADLPYLMAVEVGDELPDASLAPTKAVVWGGFYSFDNVTGYTADGAELLARMIDWCLG